VQTLDGLPLTVVRFRGKGRDGIEVERPFYFVWEFTDDGSMVTAYRAFIDRDEATGVAREAHAKGELPA
jgi:hypothetical protein